MKLIIAIIIIILFCASVCARASFYSYAFTVHQLNRNLVVMKLIVLLFGNAYSSILRNNMGVYTTEFVNCAGNPVTKETLYSDISPGPPPLGLGQIFLH